MHTYHLEKYQGRATRHECPNCHDTHSFTLYVDEAGDMLDEAVGRCNHVSSCGYHYTPKEYFTNHPEAIDTEIKKRKQLASALIYNMLYNIISVSYLSCHKIFSNLHSRLRNQLFL